MFNVPQWAYYRPEVDFLHTLMQMRLIEVNGSANKELCLVKLLGPVVRSLVSANRWSRGIKS